MKAPVVLVLLAALGVTATDSLADTPTACLVKEDDGGLSATGKDVISEHKSFYVDDKAYPVGTYSDQAALSETAKFCIRYEIENLSDSDAIQNFYWRLVGIRMNSFLPGPTYRQSRSWAIYSIKIPEKRVTEINAFNTSRISPEVWMTDALLAEATTLSSYASWNVVSRDEVNPGLAALLEKEGLPAGKTYAVNMVESDSNSYPVHEQVSGAGFFLKLFSRAARKGSNVRLETDVTLFTANGEEASIYAPALQAMVNTKSADDLDYYSAFIESFHRFFKEPVPNFKQGKLFALELPLESLTSDSLYLVDHPIMIRTKDAIYCYRVKSYSPFAVDFDIDSCPM